MVPGGGVAGQAGGGGRRRAAGNSHSDGRAREEVREDILDGDLGLLGERGYGRASAGAGWLQCEARCRGGRGACADREAAAIQSVHIGGGGETRIVAAVWA